MVYQSPAQTYFYQKDIIGLNLKASTMDYMDVSILMDVSSKMDVNQPMFSPQTFNQPESLEVNMWTVPWSTGSSVWSSHSARSWRSRATGDPNNMDLYGFILIFW